MRVHPVVLVLTRGPGFKSFVLAYFLYVIHEGDKLLKMLLSSVDREIIR